MCSFSHSFLLLCSCSSKKSCSKQSRGPLNGQRLMWEASEWSNESVTRSKGKWKVWWTDPLFRMLISVCFLLVNYPLRWRFRFGSHNNHLTHAMHLWAYHNVSKYKGDLKRYPDLGYFFHTYSFYILGICKITCILLIYWRNYSFNKLIKTSVGRFFLY